MVRHGGCLGLGLAAMGSARQGRNFESKFTSVETLIMWTLGMWKRCLLWELATYENDSCIVATRGVRVRWPLAFAGLATNKHNLEMQKKNCLLVFGHTVQLCQPCNLVTSITFKCVCEGNKQTSKQTN